MRYERFIALGDSCTEGLDDLQPNGIYRGWADFAAGVLAEANPDLRYANLGVRGRRLDQITTEQMPVAETLQPDLIALFGGGNDLMSSGYTTAEVTRRVHTAVQRAAGIAPKIAVFTLSDISSRMPFGWRMRPRIEALNNALREATTNHKAILVDVWQDQAVHDSRYFGPDRLHLSTPGHLRLAGHLLTALGIEHPETWLAPLPGLPKKANLIDHTRWLREQVLPVAYTRLRNRLIGREPGDGFLPKRPELLPVR